MATNPGDPTNEILEHYRRERVAAAGAMEYAETSTREHIANDLLILGGSSSMDYFRKTYPRAVREVEAYIAAQTGNVRENVEFYAR